MINFVTEDTPLTFFAESKEGETIIICIMSYIMPLLFNTLSAFCYLYKTTIPNKLNDYL